MSQADPIPDHDSQLGLPWDDELAAVQPVSWARRPEGTHFSLMSSSSSPPAQALSFAGDAARAAFRHPHAQHEIRLGQALVAYEFKRARRRSIGMVVTVDGLTVRAPKWASWTDIETALRSKERWICAKLVDQRERAQRLAASKIDWKEGAQVPFLGEHVVLVLDPRVSGAQLKQGEPTLPGIVHQALHLGLPQHASAEQIRDAVQSWLQREARLIFHDRARHFAEQMGVTFQKVSLSSAKTRWGSASADGSIRLHWRLIHFSVAIIDYVVAHELAHLREMNHSAKFWDVVRSVMPEFADMREQLKHVTIPD